MSDDEHRGPGPEDGVLFAPERFPALPAAVRELSSSETAATRARARSS